MGVLICELVMASLDEVVEDVEDVEDDDAHRAILKEAMASFKNSRREAMSLSLVVETLLVWGLSDKGTQHLKVATSSPCTDLGGA